MLHLKPMPTKNPRISVMLEGELYEILQEVAKRHGESLSEVIRRYLKIGLILSEDLGLLELAQERLKSFSDKEALSHDEVWD